jgi:gluconate 2-dehydrogenase subunit 3-like protein
MKTISRRDALRLFTSAPVAAAAAITWTPLEAAHAHERMQAAARQAARQGTAFKPKFFTAHEYATVSILVDLIIPKDERSGSATDAGVPAFMDFMMIDRPPRQVAMRGGLALIDHLCEERFANNPFVRCTDAQRRELLDDIAFPLTVTTELRPAAAFFTTFRDLTASGFWTTRMGIADLGYQGNAFVSKWNGCPDAALAKLGVSYGPDRE